MNSASVFKSYFAPKRLIMPTFQFPFDSQTMHSQRSKIIKEYSILILLIASILKVYNLLLNT